MRARMRDTFSAACARSSSSLDRTNTPSSCGITPAFGLLFLAGQSGEAVGEGIGDAKFHAFVQAQRLKVGIALIMNSSNNGTVKAMSPCAGL